jgi:hypothetical protein
MVSEENLINPHIPKSTHNNMARGQQKIQSQQKAQEKQVPYTHDLCQMVAVPVDKAKSILADPGSGALLTWYHTFIQSHSYNTFIRRHSPGASLHLLITCKLSGKNLPVVPIRESNSGLPYSKPARFHAAPLLTAGSGMEKNPDPGSGMNIPGLIFENYVSDFWVNILLFFDAGPDLGSAILSTLDPGCTQRSIGGHLLSPS